MRSGWSTAWTASLCLAWFPAGSAVAQGASLRHQAERLIAMTPAQFEALADVKDDGLELFATITTRNGFQRREGLLGAVNNDNFFRAFVDKKTGAARFQVYQAMRYVDQHRLSFETVTYETPSGPVSAMLTRIARTVGTCRRAFGCPYVELAAFDVDEALLRALVAQHPAGQAAVWKYRLKAKLGVDRDDGFVVAEIAGILRAVDHYRSAHGLRGAPSDQ